MKPYAILPALLLFLCASPLMPQSATDDAGLAFVGMKLDELFNRFGLPKMVYASRGSEEWQDDVVFVYDEGEFYLFRDRVWQVALKAVWGIRVGDPRAVAELVMDGRAANQGDCLLLPLSGGNWPAMLRVNFSAAGFVSAIYVYRSDF